MMQRDCGCNYVGTHSSIIHDKLPIQNMTCPCQISARAKTLPYYIIENIQLELSEVNNKYVHYAR